jgi:hypothetical protein
MHRWMRVSALTAAGFLALSGPAKADVIFGGNARSLAMGGAGLAIVDHSERNTLVNPAALALYNRRIRADYPNIGLRASGIPLDQAFNHLFGNPDRNDAVSLARDFGGRNSDFGVSLGWGIRFGHLDVRASGTVLARVRPDAAFQNWANTANGDLTKLAPSARADLLGAGIYSLPALTVAERVSPAGSPTRIEAGARVKLMRAVYTHYIVQKNPDGTKLVANTAPELGGGTTITKDGIALDAGLLFHPREHAGFSGAIVVTNLIDPPFRFNGTDQTGAAVRYDLQPRSYSLGSAYESGRAVFALDVVDLSRAYGNVQARFGGEYTTKGLALRAGYSSARGFTAGFGYGILQFAFGNKVPLEIMEQLRF